MKTLRDIPRPRELPTIDDFDDDDRCDHPRMIGDTCSECGDRCSHADVGAVDDGICHDADCPIHGMK